MTDRIRGYDEELTRVAKRYPEVEVLRQVTGVGPITGLAYALVLEDPTRFRASRMVGPYLGLTPKKDQSGEVDKELRITKRGDEFLRRLLVSAAQYILGPLNKQDSTLRRFGQRLAQGGKRAKKRAVVAVARKLAVLLHRLWVTGEVYEPLRGAESKEAA
jgi:transposase